MSAETTIYGAIVGASGSTEHNTWFRTFEINVQTLGALPIEDEDPPLPRSMFAAATAPGRYDNAFFRSQIIHFGASFNHFNGDWSSWLAKFEALLRRLYWYNAHLHLDMEHYGKYHYVWTPTADQFARFHLPVPLPVSEWEFSGGPRSFSG